MKTRSLLACALVLALAAPAVALAGKTPAAEKEPWIHVEVREGAEGKASVNVNLPLALAEAALMGSEGILKEHMHVRVDSAGGPDISVADLRRIWKAARDAGDAEFITVEDGGEKVRVFREGEHVCVNVDHAGDKACGEKVRLRMPVTLMDALLAGEGEELNLTAVLAELRRAGEGELVRVEDGADVVRIWVDDQPAPDND